MPRIVLTCVPIVEVQAKNCIIALNPGQRRRRFTCRHCELHANVQNDLGTIKKPHICDPLRHQQARMLLSDMFNINTAEQFNFRLDGAIPGETTLETALFRVFSNLFIEHVL